MEGLGATSMADNTPSLSSTQAYPETDFVEWLRLAADNKINVKNSWNLALIDYFHDTYLLQPGSGVNFSVASATLDGCVKVYSSRVDSVAQETGRMLSGLGSTQFEEKVDQNDGIDDIQEPIRRRTTRTNNLVPFEEIRMKELDSSLQVDPIFKKTLANFDTNNALGLLLNMLSTDQFGRVVFDLVSTAEPEPYLEQEEQQYQEVQEEQDHKLDIHSLAHFVSEIDACSTSIALSSVRDLVAGDSKTGSIWEELDNLHRSSVVEGTMFMETDDEEEYQNLVLEPTFQHTMDAIFDTTVLEERPQESLPDLDLMAYFDNTLKFDGIGGRESWKIIKLRQQIGAPILVQAKKPPAYQRRAPISYIDFLSDDEMDEEELFAEPAGTIEIPVIHRTSKQRNRLPYDAHFNSKRLIQLFTKPAGYLKSFNKKLEVKADQDFWSQAYDMDMSTRVEQQDMEELHDTYHELYDDGTAANADNNFEAPVSQSAFKSIVRHTALNFARTSNRIDVKALKSNLWGCMEGAEQTTFSNLMQAVGAKTLDQDCLTTSVCFVCVLHLANEKGLELVAAENDLTITF